MGLAWVVKGVVCHVSMGLGVPRLWVGWLGEVGSAAPLGALGSRVSLVSIPLVRKSCRLDY